jgi:hypothetical protein
MRASAWPTPRCGLTMSTDIPEFLRHLPFDPRRKLPIPVMNQISDARWDFVTITERQVDRCIEERLCSVCGKKLDYWLALIGNEVSARKRSYTDPPMHERCALASLQLCPMINHGNMARAKAPRVQPRDGEGVFGLKSSQVRPIAWFMPITQRYAVEYIGRQPRFISGPYKRVRAWRNNEDGPGLTELEAAEVNRLLRDTH